MIGRKTNWEPLLAIAYDRKQRMVEDRHRGGA